MGRSARAGEGAHPRIRGEYNSRRLVVDDCLGSPPHTRGILFIHSRSKNIKRLTPAYAGNMLSEKSNPNQKQAHPRIRGEYCLDKILENGDRGSPPHTRGILAPPPSDRLQIRLTPAYAGNIPWHRYLSRLRIAHPRIRGEYTPLPRFAITQVGSPPHTRGILCGALDADRVSRLTPAYAGNI